MNHNNNNLRGTSTQAPGLSLCVADLQCHISFLEAVHDAELNQGSALYLDRAKGNKFVMFAKDRSGEFSSPPLPLLVARDPYIVTLTFFNPYNFYCHILVY